MYSDASTRDISEKYQNIYPVCFQLMSKLFSMREQLSDEKAIEYLTHGASRRLSILARCIENVFTIFPIDRTSLLTKEELRDLDINLHAFFVNVSGLLDNLAWVFVYENNLLDNNDKKKFGKNDVGLFMKKTQNLLPDEFKKYIETLTKWHSKYSKNYRDALAHRVPLYVPPSILGENEKKKYLELEAQLLDTDLSTMEGISEHGRILHMQSQIGRPSPFFSHSLTEGRPIYLHAQIITDFFTIEEIINMFCDHFFD